MPREPSALLSSIACLSISSSSYAPLLFMVARRLVFSSALFLSSFILACSAADKGVDLVEPSRTGRYFEYLVLLEWISIEITVSWVRRLTYSKP